MSKPASQGGFIHIDPIGKPRLTRRDGWKKKDGTFKRKCVNDWYEYKDALHDWVSERGIDPTQFVGLNIVFFVPMPKSWSKKKKAEKNGTYHDQKPDIDNLEKAFLDSVLKDDSKIACVNKMKLWSDKGGISFNFNHG